MPNEQFVTTINAVPTVKYAGFWVRAAALLIDSLIMSVLQLIIGLAFENWVLKIVISSIIYLGYAVLMITTYQATLGKMAVGLRVERTNGERIGLWRTMLREIIGKFCSAITLGVGYLMVAWTKKKQGLHDKIADTVVIEKNPSKSKTIWVVLAVIVVFAIPVIGILSSIVLASLNAASTKGKDSLGKLHLTTVQLQAGLYYYDAVRNESYLGYCGSPEALSALEAASIAGTANGNVSSYVCNDSKDAWAASVPLLGTGYACADSTGTLTDLSSPLASGQTSCGSEIQ